MVESTGDLIPRDKDMETVLRFMEKHGSSVVLTYGEDTGRWECSWIVGGERFTAQSMVPIYAVHSCLDKAIP